MDVRGYVSCLPESEYQVFSGKGWYSVDAKGAETKRSFPRALNGALIERGVKCDE